MAAIKLEKFTVYGDRLLVRPLEQDQEGLLVGEPKSAGIAEVIDYDERAIGGIGIVGCTIVVYERMASMPIKLEDREGRLNDYFIIRLGDVAGFSNQAHAD